MEKDMTKGSPLPVILQFTLPLIIGNIFQQLYNMADTIIVGRYVGADALAAVGSWCLDLRRASQQALRF